MEDFEYICRYLSIGYYLSRNLLFDSFFVNNTPLAYSDVLNNTSSLKQLSWYNSGLLFCLHYCMK